MDTDAIRQHIVDYVVPLVIAQGKPSMQGRSCAYRGGTYAAPLKCAIGFMIDDDLYSSEMEGAPAHKIMAKGIPTTNPIFRRAFEEDRQFLWNLQQCHDEASRVAEPNFVHEFKRKVKAFCKRHKLNFPA